MALTSTASGSSTSARAMKPIRSWSGSMSDARSGSRAGGERRLVLAQDLGERHGGAGADAEPVVEPGAVDPCLCHRLARIVGADLLDETPVPGVLRVGHHDVVVGPLLRAEPSQTNADHGHNLVNSKTEGGGSYPPSGRPSRRARATTRPMVRRGAPGPVHLAVVGTLVLAAIGGSCSGGDGPTARPPDP